ncbi:alpha/beta hydrolase [Streptomyces sp. NPDC001978]|uniref:alpha/beta hydrolase n=1 Tax=Streptomyces sp. NPDC001978 TaxID=3364627 RepID=UPI0036B81AE4
MQFEGEVRQRLFSVNGHTLSGIEAGSTKAPRGVVLALHGAGYTSRYWDAPNGSGNSLLGMGSALGFRVVAVDRPGYGVSADTGESRAGIDAQAELLGALIESLHAESAPAPLFLVGHSFGALLAVRLAACEAAPFVSGVDVAGLPVRWRTDVREAITASADAFGLLLRRPDVRASLFFGPPSTYDTSVLGADLTHRIPRTEMADSLASPAMLKALAPEVRVPVQCTLGEHESAVVAGPEAVAASLALFTSSPRALTYSQPGAGHNVSLHRVGRAYHLRALAFFEECRTEAAHLGVTEAL